ncbi:MAG: aminoglycoside phosphotransferase family protein [Chloroflexi bacterium]|nr:aminoglycoside phosphotransferase family protein [Chloroflexota bacterium]
MTRRDPLCDLLTYLAETDPQSETTWRDWRVTRVTGGWNNLLYRATNDAHDLAIKFTRRDARDRAGREYAALLVLQQSRLNIAPAPVLRARERYRLPVVVQTWIAGEVKNAPPVDDAEWMLLLEHYAALARVTRANTSLNLLDAVLTMKSARDAQARVRQQLARLPNDAHNESIAHLIQQMETARFPEWDAPPATLCRVDPNILNFIRRDHAWLSVDWENAGWGDPAFEIADLMAHPSYISVSPARWEWAIERYCRLMNDPQMETRIRTYHRIMLVWWVVRCARYLDDIPRGTDRRLAVMSNDIVNIFPISLT